MFRENGNLFEVSSRSSCFPGFELPGLRAVQGQTCYGRKRHLRQHVNLGRHVGSHDFLFSKGILKVSFPTATGFTSRFSRTQVSQTESSRLPATRTTFPTTLWRASALNVPFDLVQASNAGLRGSVQGCSNSCPSPALVLP